MDDFDFNVCVWDLLERKDFLFKKKYKDKLRTSSLTTNGGTLKRKERVIPSGLK